jgi:hypothetical protein
MIELLNDRLNEYLRASYDKLLESFSSVVGVLTDHFGRRFLIAVIFFLFSLNLSTAQDWDKKKVAEFLPKGHLFEPLLLDPLEAQFSGSYVKNSNEEMTNGGYYAPFSIGFRKEIMRFSRSATDATELGIDLASFTQFEIYEDKIKNTTKRQMLNVDYKVSLFYNVKKENHTTRIRVFHLSSHFGDDYTFSRKIYAPVANPVNYEQFDFIHSIGIQNLRVYFGGGLSLRPPKERKPYVVQAGFLYKKPSESKKTAIFTGLDLKVFQQTKLSTNIKACIGYQLGKEENNPIKLVIEGYYGKLPYSPLDQEPLNWVGVGMYCSPF